MRAQYFYDPIAGASLPLIQRTQIEEILGASHHPGLRVMARAALELCRGLGRNHLLADQIPKELLKACEAKRA